MNLEEELKIAQQKLEEIVNLFNQKEQEKQELLKESLRLEGEIRGYNKLKGKENGFDSRPRNKSK